MASSRFDRPLNTPRTNGPNKVITRDNYYSPKQLNTQTQSKNSFSTPKSIEQRAQFKPFGKALDTEQNKNITTFGDDIFIEYNPAIFIGDKGIMRINKYIDHINNAIIKGMPLDYYISIKQPEYGQPSKQTDAMHSLDWWGDDDINLKINEYMDMVSISSHKPSMSINIIAPEILEKLEFANMLISTFGVQLTKDSAHTVNFRSNLPSITATSTSARFEPRILKNKNDTSTQSMSSNNTQHTQHIQYDDNYSIRVSNFTNPYDLTPFDVKDIISEYIGDIKCRVFIPTDRETKRNKDFVFINFVDETDMARAFKQLTAQRIFMESAILYFELSNRR